MSDQELLRYSRQIMLPQIDIAGQRKLLASRVLLFGVGGIGSPAAMYLVSSGIGSLTLVDPDRVDASNLQRQIIYCSDNIGDEKVEAAKQALASLNAQTSVRTINAALTGTRLRQEVAKADLVLDATDNFAARFAINEACVKTGTPLVVGAAIRFEGQVMVFTMRDTSACYGCLYPDQGELEESCTQTGILGSVAGLIGCIQATEAIKLLLDTGGTLADRILLVDALNMEWHSVKINKDPQCSTCATQGH
ncbi:MAG: molybdopterin-synthase adenylyltransferase MoeB [Proteobacteria bacterium]|nr:molybdopterin-synthase adenylyltransferase MoeB [Pseudomonadota bacterium]